MDPPVDGFRIDAAKHVEKSFWTEWQKYANTYTLGEVFASDTDPISYICNYQTNALSGTFNYPLWYSMRTTLLNVSQPMSGLQSRFDQLVDGCQDTTLLGTFVENQDVPRFAVNVTDISILKNAMTFSMLTDGIPVIYYGAEQRFTGAYDPYNREALWTSDYNTSAPLYQHIKGINTARNAIANVSTYDYWNSYWTYKSKVISAQDDIIALRKGYDQSIVFAITNRGSDMEDAGPYELTDTNFIQGTTLVEIFSCATLKAGEYGVFNVTLKGGEPQVWLPASLLINSTDTCPHVSRSASNSVTSAGSHVSLWAMLFPALFGLSILLLV
jgi:alpha-amylase